MNDSALHTIEQVEAFLTAAATLEFRKTGPVRRRTGVRHRFAVHYTPADIHLLAKTDELHETLSGPATKKIFEHAFTVFENAAFERLASISVGHLYNLRKSTGYKKKRPSFTKTKSRSLPIGQRRKPTPEGKPGYLRIVIRVGAGFAPGRGLGAPR